MSVDTNNTSFSRLWSTSITATIATRLKLLVDQSLGNLALPDQSTYGSVSPATPQYTRGGQRIIGGVITSTDGTARDVILWRSSVLTNQLQTVNPTGALAIGSTTTFTRTSGDFRLDGWTLGDIVAPFGPGVTTLGGMPMPDASINAGSITALNSVGIPSVITGVTSTTMTVTPVPSGLGAGSALTVELLPSCRLVRLAPAARQTVAINAGTAAATASALLIGASQELDITNLLAADRGQSLGPTDLICVSTPVAISAVPATINFTATSLLY